VTDYTFAGSIILFTGFVHSMLLVPVDKTHGLYAVTDRSLATLAVPGYIKDSGMGFLSVTRAFQPSTDRSWVIHFWELPVKWIFAALPFGFLITILFYFDVSTTCFTNR
jgi:hypothetical protein